DGIRDDLVTGVQTCALPISDAQASSTSYGAAVGSEDRAQLFTVPQEQMEHVQVVAVEKARLARILRLTGSVAYNNFETTPVITRSEERRVGKAGRCQGGRVE